MSHSDQEKTGVSTPVGHEAPKGPPPAPNGGLEAWLQIVGAHLLFFNSWGIVLSFGAFQSYYTQDLLSSRSTSDIAWIGTFQGFLLFLVGIISGPIFDKGYFRQLVMLGSFLVVFGVMMTSISTEYYQVFLAQGVCTGIGAGCLFLPSVGIAATYFTTKRAFATGITAAGGSVGGVLYPIIFKELIPKIGFGWTTRVIGFIALATLIFPILTMRARLPPAKRSRRLFDANAWKDAKFDVLSAGFFLAFVGLYLPFFYVPDYTSLTLGTSGDFGFYLVAVLNAASIFGRIIPGLLADRFGSLNLLVFATLATGIIGFGWIGVKNLGGLIVFCISYGFFSGAVVSLPPTIVVGITPELSLVGTWMGMSFSLAGLGLLVGNPIAGSILGKTSDYWLGAQVFGAVFTTAGGVAFLVVRILRAKKASTWKL